MVLPFLALGAMAIGGVASAIGAKKQAEETNRGIAKANKVPLVEKSNLNLGELVRESEAAGFNPLTIVRAGGVAGYATHTTTGHNAHLFASRQSPGGAFLGGIGNMFSNVGSAGLNLYQNMASIASSERIAAMSALPSYGGGGYGGAGSGAAYGSAGDMFPQIPVSLGSARIKPDPNWSPAGAIEEQYGDVASWAYGLAKIAADVSYTAGLTQSANSPAARDGMSAIERYRRDFVAEHPDPVTTANDAVIRAQVGLNEWLNGIRIPLPGFQPQ